jgi:glycosyltransferase involved in cell wall biosynthesis
MLSIIIPTFEEEKAIGKTLSQLRKLNGIEYEIIVADGDSGDKTVSIAEKNADKVVVFKPKGVRTASEGRNIGARFAKGEYFVFIDSDVDIPDPNDFFKKALSEFENDNFLVALTVKIKIERDLDTLADRIFMYLLNSVFIIFNNFLKIGNAQGKFQMVKREAFEKVGGYNEKLVAAEDGDMFYRLSKIGRTKLINSLTVFHTGRRAHQIGWTRLIFQWMLNWISMVFRKKAVSKVWEAIR